MKEYKFCEYCGEQISSNDSFCGKCGTKITEVKPQNKIQYGQAEILVKYEAFFKTIIIIIVAMAVFMIGFILVSNSDTENNSGNTEQNEILTNNDSNEAEIEQNNSIINNNNTDANDTSDEESKTKDSSKANIGDAYVEIGKYKVVKYGDDKILIVEILYTNNANEAEEFAYNIDVEAYQDGVELDSSWMKCSWYDKNDSYIDTDSKIQPNKTVTVRKCFYLNNTSDNVEITLQHYFWENLYDKASKTLVIK